MAWKPVEWLADGASLVIHICQVLTKVGFNTIFFPNYVRADIKVLPLLGYATILPILVCSVCCTVQTSIERQSEMSASTSWDTNCDDCSDLLRMNKQRHVLSYIRLIFDDIGSENHNSHVWKNWQLQQGTVQYFWN